MLDDDQARLADVLAGHFGAVVPDSELAEQPTAQSASLRHQMTQLRSRLRPLSLSVSRARRQGYQMRDANRRAARTGSDLTSARRIRIETPAGVDIHTLPTWSAIATATIRDSRVVGVPVWG